MILKWFCCEFETMNLVWFVIIDSQWVIGQWPIRWTCVALSPRHHQLYNTKSPHLATASRRMRTIDNRTLSSEVSFIEQREKGEVTRESWLDQNNNNSGFVWVCWTLTQSLLLMENHTLFTLVMCRELDFGDVGRSGEDADGWFRRGPCCHVDTDVPAHCVMEWTGCVFGSEQSAAWRSDRWLRVVTGWCPVGGSGTRDPPGSVVWMETPVMTSTRENTDEATKIICVN